MVKRVKTVETKKPAAGGKERNYVAYEEAGEAIPPDEVATEHIDSFISLFGEGEMDIPDFDQVPV